MLIQVQAREQLARLRKRLQPANGDAGSLAAYATRSEGAAGGIQGAGSAAQAALRPPAASPGIPAPGGAKAHASPSSVTAELAPGKLTRADEIKLVRSWPVSKVRDLAQGQIQRSKDALEKASDVPWYTDPYIRVINHIRWGPALKQIEDAEASYAHGEQLSGDAAKESYISAWTTARLALTTVAQEARFGETGYIYLAEDLAHALVEAAEPYVKPLGAGLEVAFWGLLAFGVIQAVGK